jgi:hypothetical protein
MHAYHDQKLPGGFKNPRIIMFYQRAKNVSAYPADAYVMKNVKEYFACTATAYLYGVTAKEPYRREEIEKTQPKYFECLKALFGPDAGNYVGSLNP